MEEQEEELGILVSSTLQPNITPLPSFKTHAMAVKTQFQFCCIVIIDACIPALRHKLQIRALREELEAYVADLTMKNPHSSVILAGDLNARLDPTDSTLHSKHNSPALI